jgi:hypothetical protein
MSGVTPGVIASNLKRIGKQTLVGYVDIEVPGWRIRFKGCLWHQKGDKEWLAFPSREWLKDGRRQFADLVEITDRSVRDRFQRAALDAVHQLANTSSGGRPGQHGDAP